MLFDQLEDSRPFTFPSLGGRWPTAVLDDAQEWWSYCDGRLALVPGSLIRAKDSLRGHEGRCRTARRLGPQSYTPSYLRELPFKRPVAIRHYLILVRDGCKVFIARNCLVCEIQISR